MSSRASARTRRCSHCRSDRGGWGESRGRRGGGLIRNSSLLSREVRALPPHWTLLPLHPILLTPIAAALPPPIRLLSWPGS